MEGRRADACTGWRAEAGARSCRPAEAGVGWRRLAQAQSGASRLPHLYMKLHCTDHLQNNYRTTTEQLQNNLQNNYRTTHKNCLPSIFASIERNIIIFVQSTSFAERVD